MKIDFMLAFFFSFFIVKEKAIEEEDFLKNFVSTQAKELFYEKKNCSGLHKKMNYSNLRTSSFSAL